MSEIYFWAKAIPTITIVSLAGAKVAKEINLGHIGWYWNLIPGIASVIVWQR